MTSIPADPAGRVEAPLAPATTAALRSEAAAAPYPRNELLAAAADYHDRNREAHAAAVAADPEAVARALLARAAAGEHIEGVKDRAADQLLSLLALAADRRPAELSDLFAPLVRSAVADLAARVDDLEAVAAGVPA